MRRRRLTAGAGLDSQGMFFFRVRNFMLSFHSAEYSNNICHYVRQDPNINYNSLIYSLQPCFVADCSSDRNTEAQTEASRHNADLLDFRRCQYPQC